MVKNLTIISGIILIIAILIAGCNTTSRMPLNNEFDILWDFENTVSDLGWSIGNQISEMQPTDRFLRLVTTGNDPYLFAPGGFFANGDVYDRMEVVMRNQTPARAAQVFFITETHPGWVAEQRVDFMIRANSELFHTYTIDLTQNPRWQGRITGLRFDPQAEGGRGNVDIKSIRLYSSTGYAGVSNPQTIGSNGVDVAGAPIARAEFGLEVNDEDRLVMMSYFLSIDLMLNHPPNQGNIFNTREFLERDLWNRDFGAVHSTWFWDEPYLGYYSPLDEGVIEQHVQWMNEASIDIIIIDNTNVQTAWTQGDFLDGLSYYEVGVVRPQTHFLETLLRMRQEGKQTPHVVFWQHTNQHLPGHDTEWSVTDIYNRFYRSGRYNELFVSWDGLPFMIVAGQIPRFAQNRLTVRRMWALQPTVANREWVFMDPTHQRFGRNNQEVEQVGVTPAPHYHYQTSAGAFPRSGGKMFRAQWENVFNREPKFVTINMFNLWSSISFPALPGIPGSVEGELQFTDTFTREFSVDIEPMRGGHGDLYLRWTGEYARAFKAGLPIPNLAMEQIGGVIGHFPLYEHNRNGIGGFGTRTRAEVGTTMLGLQSSFYTYDPKPEPYNGEHYLNVMFDTMTANLFAEGWMSVRREISPDELNQNPQARQFAASFHVARPDRADSTTELSITYRFLNPNGQEIGRDVHRFIPDQWNRFRSQIPAAFAANGGIVEIIFQATGGGTKAWYGNWGIDYLTLETTDQTRVTILESFE